MSPKTALRPAPEIVCESDCGDRSDGWGREPDHRTDERQPEPPVIHGLRPAGEHELDELATAMRKPTQVTTRGAMLELEVELFHLEPRSDGVDRHPRLDPEAHRDREHHGASLRGEPPLAGEGLPQDEAAAQPDQRARRPLREPEAASFPDTERCDREVCAGLSEPPNVSDEIRIAQEQGSRLELLLGHRQRLALATAPEPDHPRAGCFCDRGGSIAGAVVGHHDRRVRKVGA